MIYMVDHVFADPAVEPEWHAWYASYLRKLTAVPGIRSAQRFKALGCSPSRYLAMYTVDSADVYTSAAYRAMGGGGSQSARFHGAYRLWTRNLFTAVVGKDAQRDASIRAPQVQENERVLVFDRDDLPPRRFAPPLLVRGGETAVELPSSSRSVGRDRDDDRGRRGPSDAYRLEERATWLESIGLHMTMKYRGLVVLDADTAAEAESVRGSFLYEPFTAFMT